MKAYFGALMACLLAAPGVAQRTAPKALNPSPAEGPVPIEAFAALPALDTPHLSPDGTHIAAKVAMHGKQYLVVLPLFGANGTQFAQMGSADTVDIDWWRWVGDQWLAVGVGSDIMLDAEKAYVTRVIGVDAAMHQMNKIDWDHSGIRADDVIWAARDGTPRIMLSKQTGVDTIAEGYPSVYDVDLSSGKMHLVTPGLENVYDWYADAAGALRMGYRYDDETGRVELLYRAGDRGRFATIATGRRSDKSSITMPDIFRADGSAIATADGDSQGHGYLAAYEVSLPDLKLGKKIYGAQGYDIDGVIPNANDDDIDGVNVTDTYSHVVWINPRLKQLQDDLDQTLGAQRLRIVSWNADRTKLLVEVGGPSEAGELYYWDTTQGAMKFYAFNNAILRARTLSPVTTIRYPARDGLSIEAVLTLPRNRPGKDLPLIVVPHGGPGARDSEGWDWWAQFLAESGYAVIQPNYRGSSGYGADFTKKGEGEWGLKMQDDLVDAVTYLARQGIADPKRVCIAGASYGGYAAMRAAERDGAVYRCAISYAGVSDLAALERYNSEFINGNGLRDWLKREAPNYALVSPRNNAANFAMPILLMHGKADLRVPVDQSRMMASALKAAGKPYEYIEQPLADHFFSRSQDRLQFLQAMKAFLDKYNPA